MKSNKVVLITGASSGIGKSTALHLAKSGFKVFAGVRKQVDGDSLKKESTNEIIPVILDVTNEDSIKLAFEKISKEANQGLYGLINNAGVSYNAPLEIMPAEKIKLLIDVNVSGLLMVTQKFLPLLRKEKGRLINISSGHGLWAIPDKSVYAGSKFAVQGITDSLRVELKPFGIKVSSIIVGKVKTSVLGKILSERKEMIESATADVVSKYSALIDYFDKNVKDIPGIDAEEVSKVIEESLEAVKPKSQYLIGPGSKKMKKIGSLPVWLRDWLIDIAINKSK